MDKPATTGIRCVIFLGHKMVLTTNATPSFGVASKLHFIFVSQVKKPMCKSIFHLAVQLLLLKRGLWYTVKGKMFLRCLEFVFHGELFVCDTALDHFLTQQRRKLLPFSHNSESDSQNKVRSLNLWQITNLSISFATVFSYGLTHLTFRQRVTVLVSCTPTSIVPMQRHWGCSQASSSLGGRLRSGAAACSR